MQLEGESSEGSSEGSQPAVLRDAASSEDDAPDESRPLAGLHIHDQGKRLCKLLGTQLMHSQIVAYLYYHRKYGPNTLIRLLVDLED